MKFDEKLKELDVLVDEANEKRLQATRELSEINEWIKQLKNKQKDILKTCKDAEKRLEGFSVQNLQDKSATILREYKERGGFLFDFYGTDNIDLEKLINEKVFLNKMIDVLGGERIVKYYNITHAETKSTERAGKTKAFQKTVLKKMCHRELMKAIEPYLIDKEHAKSRAKSYLVH
ncbi:MAG: hypothetical protein U9N33_08210 [Campylobacterota bacterium]|nr:hypothetical protein [Campylobacterota bacterium]